MTNTDPIADLLVGHHFVEHTPGVGEHIDLTPQAAAHLAATLRTAGLATPAAAKTATRLTGYAHPMNPYRTNTPQPKDTH